MILCTECYIQRESPSGSQTLMLHRNKKSDDINQGKWIGLGGKFEAGESPEQCLVREVHEEAGVMLTDYTLRGIVTFATNESLEEPLYIFVYTATEYTGDLNLEACTEGTLHWVDTDKLLELNLWEGDRLFWGWMLEGKTFFSAHFIYEGEKLIEHDVCFH